MLSFWSEQCYITSIMKNKRMLNVNNINIRVKNFDGEDYISLTDMLKAKDNKYFVESWLRNRNTVEFLGVWESLNNPNFNYVEFDVIKSFAGLNSFKMSVKEWTERTNAIGVKAITGRYGGTYAHKDIAFEFGMWISPAFKLYLIKDYERLKESENKTRNLEWDIRRILASTTYLVHTDAVKGLLISGALPWEARYGYASEADILNLAVFGTTAAEWKEKSDEKGNLRDSASIIELLILEELQLLNAELIEKGLSKEERLKELRRVASVRSEALRKISPEKDLKRLE